MDRFIACQGNKIDPSVVNLKSNMDRFIESCTKLHTSRNGHLKSNMDRFIVAFQCVTETLGKFKIQYG